MGVVAVNYDPFAQQKTASRGPIAVDYDPFSSSPNAGRGKAMRWQDAPDASPSGASGSGSGRWQDAPDAKPEDSPPVAGAHKGSDGQWYLQDPNEPGSFPRVEQDGGGYFIRSRGQRVGIGPQQDRGFGGYVADEFSNAVMGSLDNVRRDYAPKPQGPLTLNDFNPIAKTGEDLKAVADLAGVALSPINALIHGGVVRPGGAAIAAIPGPAYSHPSLAAAIGGERAHVLSPQERQAQGEDIVNQGLMMIAPGEAGAARVATAPGALAKVVDPITAGVSQSAAERQAGRILATRATDPAAVRAGLADDATLVAGSQPTTFQQTGDMGLGSLEREVATRDPAAFNQRRADQNEARVSALSEIQAGADPNDVAKALKSQFESLDAEAQAAIDKARADAQAKADAIGPDGNPEDHGQAVRQAVRDAEDASDAKINSLYRVIDPDRTATANVAQTASAAKSILGEISRAARPMEGEEAAIFDFAANMPALSPFDELTTLRSRVSDAMRQERGPEGSPQALRRLTQLRGAIEDNLTNSIAHQISQDDAAVARGTIPEEAALSAKVKSWVDEHYAARQATGLSNTGGHGGIAPIGPARSAGVPGAKSEGVSGLGGPESNPGLPGDGPTISPDAAPQLKAASDAYKLHSETFDEGPVGQILRSTGTKGNFRLPDGKAAGQFFRSGPTGYSDMQALFRAVPRETALPIIEDYASTTLRRAALGEDGVLDPTAYVKWKKGFRDALRALPDETQAKFADAASAGQTVADAMKARTQALKEAQQGAIGEVMHLSSSEDVVKAVGKILTGKEAGKNMLALAKASAKDPAAIAGLRQAAADFIAQSLIGNTEAGTSGVNLIKADAYQAFMKGAKPALRIIFKPEEVDLMQAIADDIHRAKRSENGVRLPGGSNTAQDLTAVNRGKPSPVARTVLDAIGAVIGHAFVPGGGEVAGVLGAELVQAFRAAGILRVNHLVTEAMLNPAVARRLLAKVGPKPPSTAFVPLAKAITAAQLASFATAPSRDDR